MAAVLLLSAFIVLLLFGFPIVVAMGGSSLLYILLFIDSPPIVVVRQMMGGVDSFTLLAIPFFIVAGGYMQRGGISRRIVNIAKEAVGSLPGGMALVTIWSSCAFGALTGSGTSTAAAIGSIMIPALKNEGYDEDFSCALQSVAGMFGPLIPPSILMVLYATSSGTSVSDMLISGILPGLIMAALLSIVAIMICTRKGWKGVGRFSPLQLLKSIKEAFFAILVPIIILGGIYSGTFTPTEAAMVGCLYCLVVSLFIYREFSVRNVFRITIQGIKTTGMTLLIMATSQSFAWVMTRERIPQRIASAFVSFSDDPTVFLLCVGAMLLVIDCFIEAPPAVMVLAPMLTPTAIQYGISPVHFGVVMVTGLVIGLSTPPVGACLFVVSGVADRPIQKFARRLLPFILVTLIGYILIIFFPSISTALPNSML